MSGQLSLDLRLRDASSLTNFYAGRNKEALERVRWLAGTQGGRGQLLFLWGERGAGKTHLLEAACREVHAHRGLARYVPLGTPDLAPAILEDAEAAALVCIDDIERIAGASAWESALFTVIERLRDAGGHLIAASTAGPTRLGLKLPDLATRLAWGPVYQLHLLDDSEKIAAIRLRARNRGLDMPLDAARYILNRYPRDMASLFALLDRIDSAALARRHRITIPFLRSLETPDAF